MKNSQSAFLALTIMTVSTLVFSQDTSKPLAPFIVIAPGVVKDAGTGLEWMRCSLGQAWSESSNTCEGDEVRLKSWDAMAKVKHLNSEGGFAQTSNWRIPTVRELAGIRLCTKGLNAPTIDLGDGLPPVSDGCKGGENPMVNQEAFPETPARAFYWSSSGATPTGNFVWSVSTRNGDISAIRPYLEGAIRLVR